MFRKEVTRILKREILVWVFVGKKWEKEEEGQREVGKGSHNAIWSFHAYPTQSCI